jgi:hypothetical protein
MREPQEVQDEAHEQILERVAAVDVAKASGMVCTRVPHPSRPGRRLTKVWEVDATTNAITELAEHLVEHGIEQVTVESTSDIGARGFITAAGKWCDHEAAAYRVVGWWKKRTRTSGCRCRQRR